MANFNITVNSTTGSKGTAGTITMVFPGGSSGAGSAPTNRLTVAPNDTITFIPGTLSTDGNMSPLTFALDTVLTPSIEGVTGINPSTDTIVSGGSNRVGTVKPYAGDFRITLRNPNTVYTAEESGYFTISGDSTPTITGSGGQDINAGTSLDTQFTKAYTVGGMGSSNKALIAWGSNSQASLNGGAYQDSGNTFDVVNNDVIRLRMYSPSGYNSEYKNNWLNVSPHRTFTVATDVYPVRIYTGNAPTGDLYGFETFNSSGNKTLSVSSRSPRYVSQGAGTVVLDNSAGSAPATLSDSDTITVSGMTTDDTWVVLLNTGFNSFIAESAWEVVKATGQFTVSFTGVVNAGQNVTLGYTYYVLRS